MRYRAMLGDQFIEVEAETEAEAQNMAFAKHVRQLSPSQFQVWPTGADDDWREDPREA